MYLINLVIKMLKLFIKKTMGIGSTKMVILVRTDISMGRGKIASQVAHAAVSLYDSSLQTQNKYLKTWLHTGQPKVVLKIDSDGVETLTSVYKIALSKGLNTCLIYDSGRTQVDSGTLTAVGIGPNLIEEVDEITRKFKLL